MAYRSSTVTGYTTGTSASVSVPSGAASNDIAVVDLFVEWTSGTVTPPAGFTLEASRAHAESPQWTHYRYWKRLTAGDSGTYSFGLSASAASMVACNLFSGRITSGSPFDTGTGATQTATIAGSAGVACPSVSMTPTTAGVDLLYGVFTYNNGGATAPATWTASGTHADGVLTCYKANQPASATGSVSCSTPATDMWTVQLSALLVASAGTDATLPVGAASMRLTAPPVQLAASGNASLTVGPARMSAAAGPVALAGVANVSLAVGTAGVTFKAGIVTLGTITTRFVTAVSGNGRYFLDQASQPILVRGDSPWSMLIDLSSSEMDTYLANRAAAGQNLLLCSLIGCVENGGGNNNGETYDGILPFTSGDITTPNSTYWSRMDSYLSKAEALGITLLIYPLDGWNTKSGTVFSGKSDADCETFGNWLATRWLSRPNIMWAFGGDYDASSVPGTFADSRFNACLTGIRSAGDNRLATIQNNYMRSNSFDSSYWEARADWSFGYSYFATYDVVLAGYAKSWSGGGKPSTRPALFSEGEYDNSPVGDGGSAAAIRRQAGWALTSGSPGAFTGQERVWSFETGSPAWTTRINSTQTAQFKAILDTFAALAKWHLLVPDTGSALVTSGRGTPYVFSSQSDNRWNSTSDYVTAAVTPDKTLAVIYNPDTSTRSITISAAAVGANPTLRRVDPSTGTSTGMTWTTTPTAGTNAAGDDDWLFIIEADPITDAGLIVGPASARFFAGPVALAGTSNANLPVSPARSSLTAGPVALAGTSNAALTVGASFVRFAAADVPMAGEVNGGITVGAAALSLAAGSVALSTTSTATLTVDASVARFAAGDVPLAGVANVSLGVGASAVQFAAGAVTMYAGSAATLPVGAASFTVAASTVALAGVANVALTVGPAGVTFVAGSVALVASQPNATLPVGASAARFAAAPVTLAASNDAQLTVGPARLQLTAAPVSMSGTSVAELLVGAARLVVAAGSVQLRTPDATMPIGAAALRITAGSIVLAAVLPYPLVRQPAAHIRPNDAKVRIRP